MNEVNTPECKELGELRVDVCLEAAYELEALALLLVNIVPEEHNITRRQVRGVAGRIKELASVLMSGLGDDLEGSEALDMVVRLKGYKEGLT